MSRISLVSRRDFLEIAGAASAASFVLGIRIGQPQQNDAAEFHPNAWLSIGSDGETSVWLTKAEMGQGVYTALPMIVAEELDADWSHIRVLQATVEPELLEFFGTGGSSSVSSCWKPLRCAGAAAREMIIRAGAEKWGVSTAECRTSLGRVIHQPTNRSIPYVSVLEAARKLPVPQQPN